MKRKKLSDKTKKKIRKSANNRCGYCLARQDLVYAELQFDHQNPLSKGGDNDEKNYWLACPKCNRAKSDKTDGFDEITKTRAPLFNPRTQNWHEHFEWSADGLYIVGKTAIGRVTVIEVNLNNDLFIRVRQNWIKAGWHPPEG
ncbi:MAG TPA: HNH endonuclease signature motif containing protein [Sphingobacteriaceae bacterium]